MASYLYDRLTAPTNTYIVIFNYRKQSLDEISVRAGDEVEVIEKIGSWVKVSTTNNQIGFVPQTYLAIPTALEAENWYFPDISRIEAIELLEKAAPGTYLVRPSSSNDKHRALSISTSNPAEKVIHYEICYDPKKGFYIHNNLAEISLRRLLSYYQNDSIGKLQLKQVLISPSPKDPPRIYQLIPRNCPIPADEIQKVSEIGGGNFGTVYQGYFRHYKIAIKELKADSVDAAFRKELETLKALNHPNVVTFYGHCIENKYMIFEFVDFCLEDQLKAITYSSNHKLLIAMQVARGMTYVHSMNYVHRDLAARNILITMNLVAKISDFGLSRKMNASKCYAMSEPNGTTPYKWEALESLKKRIYNKTTDVWSFGVLMFEIYSHASLPYPGIKDFGPMITFLENGNRLPKPVDMADVLYKYVFRCWHVNPKKRPTFHDIQKYLSNFK